MRKLIMKTVVSAGLIICAAFLFFLWKKAIYRPSEENGCIAITLENADGDKNMREVFFEKDDMLIDVLKREYRIRYTVSESYGACLLEIEEIKTDFVSSYIAISVNGKYSSLGCSFISLTDGMTIQLTETLI